MSPYSSEMHMKNQPSSVSICHLLLIPGPTNFLQGYIVPEMKRWYQWLEKRGATDNPSDTTMVGMLKRFRYLRDDVRERLKKKLPAYAVPSVLVPLSRFPLNPNGKIDKPALPFPE